MIPITDNINKWLATGERGISSEAIVSHLTGVNISGLWGMSPPSDPDDLRRCILLLEAAPELKAEFPRMAECGRRWKRLVEEWDSLVALLKEECPDLEGSAPKTYKRMQAIEDEVRR